MKCEIMKKNEEVRTFGFIIFSRGGLVMIFRVSSQTPRVTIRFAASGCFTLVWFLISMS